MYPINSYILTKMSNSAITLLPYIYMNHFVNKEDSSNGEKNRCTLKASISATKNDTNRKNWHIQEKKAAPYYSIPRFRPQFLQCSKHVGLLVLEISRKILIMFPKKI